MNKKKCVPLFTLKCGRLAIQDIIFCNFVHTEHFHCVVTVVVGLYIPILGGWTKIEKIFPRPFPIVDLQDFIYILLHFITVFILVTESCQQFQKFSSIKGFLYKTENFLLVHVRVPVHYHSSVHDRA